MKGGHSAHSTQSGVKEMQKLFSRFWSWLQLPALGAGCDALAQMSLRELADLPTRRVSEAQGDGRLDRGSAGFRTDRRCLS